MGDEIRLSRRGWRLSPRDWRDFLPSVLHPFCRLPLSEHEAQRNPQEPFIEPQFIRSSGRRFSRMVWQRMPGFECFDKCDW